jgi:hypothetical protein
MRIPTLLAAASVAIFSFTTTASAQTGSDKPSGAAPGKDTSSTVGDTNPGSNTGKASETPAVTQSAPNTSTDAGAFNH